MNTDKAKLDNIRAQIARDPLPVHQFFFPHRHTLPPAEFHDRLLRDWYTSRSRLVQTVFRGGAKSTLGEEAITLLTLLQQERNILIIGSSETRAKERLEAIKYELTTNPRLHEVFGDQGEAFAPIWQASKIVTPLDVCIQALGWDQSMRGIKHHEARPTFCWPDDIEDEDNAKDPVSREKVIKRMFGTVLPAVDGPGARIRVTGTIIDAESFVVRLAKLPQWKSRIYPVKYLDPISQSWVSSWPARKPLHEIDELQESYREIGQSIIFDREYMCQATRDEDKAFNSSYYHPTPIQHAYQLTYAIYDPARTIHDSSSHTGKIVASWANNKLIIWESGGYHWMPDQIVSDMFSTDAKYTPALIGIEKDGLEEFLMQPIRHEAVRRGHVLPLRALKAPKGKLSFIRGLQPFFRAGEVLFAPDPSAHAILVEQLNNFPSGKIDIPNALAYMLTLRIGMPMLDMFDPDVHIDPLAETTGPHPVMLGVNTENQFTTAVLVQFIKGRFVVLHDWMMEGDAGSCLSDIVKGARLVANRPFTIYCPPSHFGHYDTLGLRHAAARVPVKLRAGGDVGKGLEEARSLLTMSPHGRPGLTVSPQATWTLRALSGGYARSAGAAGVLSALPVPGPYVTMADGLLTILSSSTAQDVDEHRHYDVTSDGLPYLSAKR